MVAVMAGLNGVYVSFVSGSGKYSRKGFPVWKYGMSVKVNGVWQNLQCVCVRHAGSVGSAKCANSEPYLACRQCCKLWHRVYGRFGLYVGSGRYSSLWWGGGSLRWVGVELRGRGCNKLCA